MKRREVVIPVPYPTDKHGEPIHPYELGYSAEWEHEGNPRNNHHHAFYKRRFGATAIGSAYRNLEALQTNLIIDEHVFLHRTYSGFQVPHEAVMLERIEAEYDAEGSFKEPNPLGGYALRRITYEDIKKLEGAYHE